MAQAVTAAIPLQVPTPPRVLEELSGQIDKMAPTALNKLDELSGQIGKMAPTAFNEYVRDFWQRSVLFLDILRQRGNQREDMLAHQRNFGPDLRQRAGDARRRVAPSGQLLAAAHHSAGGRRDRRPQAPRLRHRSACRAGTGDWRLQAVERDRRGVQGRAPSLLRWLYGFACGGTAG